MKKTYKQLVVLGIVSLVILLNGYISSCTKDDKKSDAAPTGTSTSTTDNLTQEELQGGLNGSTTLESEKAFIQPIPSMSGSDLADFNTGRNFFDSAWVAASGQGTAKFDGLGPLFNNFSCTDCHVKSGRGRTPLSETEQLSSVLIRLSVAGQDPHGGPNPVPDLGLQFRNRANSNATPDGEAYVQYSDKQITYQDGSTSTLRNPTYVFKNLRDNHSTDYLISPRIAPQLPGMGLLEAIPEESILALADPDDKDQDGISGRANYVWSEEKKKQVMGRFGWKANEPSVRQQIAAAFSGDIGITTPVFPDANLYGNEQTLFSGLPNGSDKPGQPELPEPNFTHTVFATQALAVPQRRNWKDATVQKGKALFTQVACAKCHIPEFKTGNYTDVPSLSNQTIHPYTDLLLHDMGADLADGREDYMASGNEWRTPPLWGIGLTSLVNQNRGMFLMHDGRARTIEEAILWHGGEADNSKKAFMQLPKADRDALIKFVNDL